MTDCNTVSIWKSSANQLENCSLTERMETERFGVKSAYSPLLKAAVNKEGSKRNKGDG